MTGNRRRFVRNSSLLLAGGALGLTACSGGDTPGAEQPGAAAPTPPPAPAPEKPELIASYWTLAGDVSPGTGGREWSLFDFEDRVKAISARGFTGMGLWHTDLYHILESRSLGDMKRILDDNGIRHLELEFLFDWFEPEGSEARAASDASLARFLEVAEALDARHLKVGDFFSKPYEMEPLAENFARICAEAARVDTKIVFEVMPFAMIDNLADAVKMCELAGADNGGLMIDTWHIVKMGTPYEELASMPSKYLMGVELNDGFLQTPEGMDLSTETTQYRQFPGQGEFDMQGFMDAIAATGYDGPFGVEVINKLNRERSLDALADLAYDTSMSMFA